ncbi:MAG: hypothetical protein EXS63_02535 [Candidatus Omnitrophica bacterium]|nr:hypothetical protein [Candidatus Omnitrophota bacterium]
MSHAKSNFIFSLPALFVIAVVTLHPAILQAEDSCPKHAHNDHQEETDGTITLHCKCDDGYKSSGGECKAWYGTFEILDIKGDVTFYRGAKKIAISAKIQTSITADRIVTGKNGQILIRLQDGHKLVVVSNSEFEFSDPDLIEKESSIARVTRGAIRAWKNALEGKSNLRIRTPTGAVSVRGTDFTLEVLPSGEALVQVFDGEVEVSDLKGHPGVLLKKGEGIRILADGVLTNPLALNLTVAQSDWQVRLDGQAAAAAIVS